MRQLPIIILLALMMTACGTPQKALTSDRTTLDSVRVEYREMVELIHDTVFFALPLLTSERTTLDSVSHLENQYATSDARINTDGSLFHNLLTKPQEIPIDTEQKVVYKDSIIYKDRIVTHTEVKTIEKGLTFWQKAQIWGFRGSFLLVVITYTIKIIRTHIQRFRKN